jgi:hypothetical protein
VILEVTMLTKELTDQVQSEIKRLKDAQDTFLQTYDRLCARQGGLGRKPDNSDSETVFQTVRGEVIPIMEQLGMDHQTVQALCTWAERKLRAR